MRYAYHPERVCATPKPSLLPRLRRQPLAATVDDWSNASCGAKKYLLPGLTGSIQGHYDYRKEWFFYGGGATQFEKGWSWYEGVELPLCYWEPEFQRLLRMRPLEDTHAAMRRACIVRETAAPPPPREARGRKRQRKQRRNLSSSAAGASRVGDLCVHAACTPIDLEKNKLAPEYASEYNSTRARYRMQATTALPRIDPSRHPGAVVSDMTPNYLCSPKALRNLVSADGAPAHFRFLLLVRPSSKMLRSSFKMFVQWGWIKSGQNLTDAVARQLTELRSCNATLYDDPMSLSRLADADVIAYFDKCWSGVWRRFVTNSFTPYVCLRSWLARGFETRQFLLVPQERLKSIRAAELLPQLSNFTGLSYNREVLSARDEELRLQCEAADGRKGRPLVNSHGSYAGQNAEQRTHLSAEVSSEYARLSSAHASMFASLRLRTLE